jgi:hypothetical protein
MVCEPWIGAKEWLNAQVRQKISMEQRELVEAVTVLLATLPWDSMPVCALWCYLGPHWTTGTQQNDLLDILSDRITAQPALAEQLQVKGLASVATVMTDVFQKNDIDLLWKFAKIVIIFDKIDDSKNRGVI